MKFRGPLIRYDRGQGGFLAMRTVIRACPGQGAKLCGFASIDTVISVRSVRKYNSIATSELIAIYLDEIASLLPPQI